jgi:hypothetical protein
MSSESNASTKTTHPPQKSDAAPGRTPVPGDRNWKDNNPKAAFGAAKVGIDYLSFPVLLEQAVGMMAGGYKYGAHNYLVAGPSVMTYVAAAFRHMAAFVGGEDFDPHAGEGVIVHHLVAAQNCLHVVRAAQIQGIAYDDRPPKMPPGFIESLEPSIAALQRNNPDPVARYLATGRGPGRVIGEEKKPTSQDFDPPAHPWLHAQDQTSRENDARAVLEERTKAPRRLTPEEETALFAETRTCCDTDPRLEKHSPLCTMGR